MRILFALLLAPAWVAAADEGHRVQRGDTLISIQQQQLDPQVRWQDLQRLNKVRDPRRLGVGQTLAIPPEWRREEPAPAEVLSLHGNVWRQRGTDRLPLQAGMVLQEGDVLQAEPHGSTTLRFADGSRVLLRGGSTLSLEQLRQRRGTHAAPTARQRVQLQEGALEAEVPPRPTASPAASTPASRALARGAPRLDVRTPTAHLGVRGTRFRVAQPTVQAAALLEVLEGEVGAAPSGQRGAAVAAGQGWHSQLGLESLLPAPVAALPAFSDRLPLRLHWPAQTQAVAWRLQVWDAQGQQLWLDEVLSQPGFEGGATLPDGDYELRLRARSAQGLEGQDARWPLQLRARPVPPLPLAPAAGAEGFEPQPQLRWTRPQGVERFALQVASQDDFAAPLVDEAALRDTEFRRTLPEGTWHWRVASLRADGTRGPWGDAQHFVRLPPPASPPPAAQQRQGTQLQLRWQASGLPGARYQVQVWSGTQRERPWLDQVVSEPALTLEVSERGPQQLRVRTLAPDGTPGPWGSEQQFDGKGWPWGWLALPLILLL